MLFDGSSNLEVSFKSLRHKEVQVDTTTEVVGPESHFSGGVVWKLSGDLISILGFNYQMPLSSHVTRRLPGGSGRHGETPFDTVARELRDELSEEDKQFSLATEAAREIYRKTVPGDPKKGGGFHHKVFFAIEESDLVCTLRRVSIHERDGVLLGSPALYEAEGLVKSMFEDRTPRYHPMAVLTLLKALAEISPAVAGRYGTFLASNEEFMRRNS